MVSRLMLSAVLGSLGFLTVLLLQSRLLHQKVVVTLLDQIGSSNPLVDTKDIADQIRSSNPLAFSAEAFSNQEDQVCDRADILLALLSG